MNNSVCFIPIKKRSTRVPSKNLRRLNGKPLFKYIVDVAKQSEAFDDIYIDKILMVPMYFNFLVPEQHNNILQTIIFVGCLINVFTMRHKHVLMVNHRHHFIIIQCAQEILKLLSLLVNV